MYEKKTFILIISKNIGIILILALLWLVYVLSPETIPLITGFIIWQALWEGKMNQIARCDLLPKRARWSHFARSGLSAVSCEKNLPESHIINPLLTKFVRSRWLDIGLFLRVYGPRLRLSP